jgi:hypothetical protein
LLAATCIPPLQAAGLETVAHKMKQQDGAISAAAIDSGNANHL